MMRTAFSETQARFSYRNVTVTMQEQEAAEATEEELRRELTQHYGLVAARFCGLPPSLGRRGAAAAPVDPGEDAAMRPLGRERGVTQSRSPSPSSCSRRSTSVWRL